MTTFKSGVKLGKQHARVDHRTKRLSAVSEGLPPPPPSAAWYSAVKEWGMLDNDRYGLCVEAAILHLILQFSTYAGKPLVPTNDEALLFYEKATGFTPLNPSTDQGSYVMGPGGVMEFWTKTGVTCGGVLNKVGPFLQITKTNPPEWQQAVYTFGGMLTGLQLPACIVDADTVPEVWSEFDGPVAGGHEVLVNGYETDKFGKRLYTLVSWGRTYQATEEFLQNCVDEAVVVVDEVEFNNRGVDFGGLSMADLVADMPKLV